MKAVDMKCPNCMGNVVPFGDGVYGRCDCCDAVFKLHDEEEAAETDAGDADEEEDDDRPSFEEFFDEAYDDYVDDPEDLVDAYFGPRLRENPEKIDQAIKRFEIEDEEDHEIYFVLDTTTRGTCKKGFACTPSGIYLNDEDGDNAFLNWDDFDELDITYEDDGTLMLGEYPFYTTEDEVEIVAQIMTDLQD